MDRRGLGKDLQLKKADITITNIQLYYSGNVSALAHIQNGNTGERQSKV